MPDQDPNSESAKRTLSEISHLFLSDVRDRHTGGAPRPQRVPPGERPPIAPPDPPSPPPAPDAISEGPNSGLICTEEQAEAPAPPVTAVIAAHFGSGRSVRVRQYARHLAARVGRVGLIEVEDSDVRITCFDPASDEAGLSFEDAPFPESDVHHPRDLAEAIEELNCDVQQWLLAPANPRAPEIHELLSDVGHWTLLSTCDHDEVVSSYRALKGLSDVAHNDKPLLTLSLLDASGEAEIARVFGKLSGICQQFLDWPLEPGPAVVSAPGVTEDPVLFFHPGNPAPVGCEPWSVLADLVARANRAGVDSCPPGGTIRPEIAADGAGSTPIAPPTRTAPLTENPAHIPQDAGILKPGRSVPAPPYTPVSHLAPEPAASVSRAEDFAMNEQPRITPPSASAAAITGSNGVRVSPDPSEVVEISSDGSAESILAAIFSRPESGLVECPVRTPMCLSARLAIDRDRRVILLAVAREGLAELRSIGQAYRWLIENRALIGMAVPQLAIDAHRFPRLRLLVDPADASADALQPMLQSGHVTVQAYRRVRWGDRTGLLLDAA